MIYTPIEQSDLSECYNHSTSRYVHTCMYVMEASMNWVLQGGLLSYLPACIHNVYLYMYMYLEHFCLITLPERDHFTSHNRCTIIKCKHIAYKWIFFSLYMHVRTHMYIIHVYIP